ncbi:ABC transporter ATP-binding protein [Halohasta litorea]|uniref:ABC transporter ATP-binding protein n=1 Tax=Halohasta litorea TaxID=869891 RepID=A0ABD6D6U5_9EURY|nr:ABC transporter ATP-binding protein [Halohasta litorea]
MAAIQLTDLTKRYGDHLAVDGVDLTIELGEVFGFLGPNGAGKSTTINILLDFIRPTGGTATVLGYDAQREPRAVHERVGVLPEGYSLYDRLTGREHLRLAGRLNGCSVDVETVLDRIGLAPADAERPAGTYSTGMSQRLALGMATVGDPDLLVLDEPTSGLDPHGVSLLKRLVRAEADRGTTVFFSSHVLDHVEAVCDRVGILDTGRLIAVDTINGLREAVSAEMPGVEASGAELPDELTLEALFELYTTGTDASRQQAAVPGGEQ